MICSWIFPYDDIIPRGSLIVDQNLHFKDIPLERIRKSVDIKPK